MTKTVVKKIAVVLMLLSGAIISSVPLTVSVYGMDKGKKKPTISAGERAQATWDVQNVMSKHAYYYQVNQHCEEIADIWVKAGGPNDKTATWTSQFGVEVGIAQINLNYCDANNADLKKKLEDVSKTYPAIKDTQENIGIGASYAMHTNLTPVIEVAGDGKTAKGIWYSLGLGIGSHIDANGKATIGAGWRPEKYAVDFVKEGDRWKIWHLVNLFEPGPMDTEFSGGKSSKPLGARGTLPGEKPPTDEGIVHYITRTAPDFYVWNPLAKAKIYPKFPEPYYTFSETFSY
jgi:hypothetical protein